MHYLERFVSGGGFDWDANAKRPHKVTAEKRDAREFFGQRTVPLDRRRLTLQRLQADAWHRIQYVYKESSLFCVAARIIELAREIAS